MAKARMTRARVRELVERLAETLPPSEAERVRGQLEGAKRKRSHTPGVMNKTEAAYSEVLEARRIVGEIKAWKFEADTLVLSEGGCCQYTPDFRVTNNDDSIDYFEIKGSGPIRDDGIVKVKWAADKYRDSRFFLCVWRHGRWQVRLILNGDSRGGEDGTGDDRRPAWDHLG
jgi:hypothetical protein